MADERGSWIGLCAGVVLLASPAPATAAPANAGASEKQSNSEAKGFTPFILTELKIDGGNPTEADVMPVATTYFNRRIDLSALRQLAMGIAAVAQRKGLALQTVSIPDQDFAGGVLRIRIVEAGIAGVRLREGADDPLIRAYGRALAAERPLRLSTLQRYVTLIRGHPGIDAQVELVETPEGIMLDVGGQRDSRSLTLSIGNRGLALLGDWNVQGDAQATSLVTAGDRLALSAAVPLDGDRYGLFALGYALPIGTKGATVQANVSRLRTHPDFFDLTGRATGYGLQVTLPVVRSYRQLLSLSLGLDGLDSDNALFGQSFLTEKSRAGRVIVDHAVALGRSEIATSIALGIGLPVLGARTSDPGLSDTGFAKLLVKMRTESCLTGRLTLRTTLAAQLTGDRLSGAEQFVLGGGEFGRGYPGSLVAGDTGWAASGEMGWRLGRSALPQASEIYAFLDGGAVRTKSRYGFAPFRQSLSSAGAGLRIAVTKRWSVDAGATARLTRIPGLEHPHWRAALSTKLTL